jgi:hypothetical protein
MKTEQDLISKLMISKKIMEKHNTMGRANSQNTTIERPEVETYEAPSAKYNLPEEYLQETSYTPKNNQPVTEDRIMSSKLPDEIKKLMIEHPINQPSHTTSPTLSNELVDKAARLMNVKSNGDNSNETTKRTQQSQPNFSNQELKQMIRETIQEVLSENGLLMESTTKTNEVFTFKVGTHQFEGKLTKIKKLR